MHTARRAWLGVLLCFVLSAAPQTGVAQSSGSVDATLESRIVGETPVANPGWGEATAPGSGYCGSEEPCLDEFGCRVCPLGYIWAEALILGRENQTDNRPLVLDLNSNEVLLTTDDLDFDADEGFRIGYCSRVSDCRYVEFVYLGLFDQSDSAGVQLEDSLMLPDAFGLQVNNFFGADNVDVEYSSDLHSFESNLVGCNCCSDGCGGGSSVEWLAGFRYLNLDEDFSISSFDSAESTTVYKVNTENNLYGGQIGGRYRRCSGKWSCETTAKAGVFANDMEQSQAPIIDFPSFLYRGWRGSSDTEMAFVGDLNFTVICQVCELWGLRAGYNLIWLEDVALAPDQVDFSNNLGSGRNLNGDGSVFLHGVNLGLETRW
jgi:hypothetical protein